MMRVGLRPATNILQTADEQWTDRPVVNRGFVNDLDSRLLQRREVIGHGLGPGVSEPHRCGKGSGDGVIDDVNFQLPGTRAQLSGQGRMTIVDRVGLAQVRRPDHCHFVGRDRHLVAVVRADRLDRVHWQGIDGGACAAGVARRPLQVTDSGDGGGGEHGGDHGRILARRRDSRVKPNPKE